MIVDFHARLVRDHKTLEYLVEDQIADMDKNGIMVRVLSSAEGYKNNEAVYEAAKRYPQRFIPCAIINPKDDDFLDKTKHALDDLGMKIVELDSLQHGYQPEKMEYRIVPILELCRERKTIVKIYSGSTYMAAPDEWSKYFKLFPDLQFVILHMGAGDFQYGCIELAKDFPNIYLETSVACEYPALKKCLREIDISRLLFGTNYPDYFSELEIMKFDYYHLDNDQKKKIFYENAIDLLKSEGGNVDVR